MKIRARLFKKFFDKAYRQSYVDSFTDAYIATQIQVLREERALSQIELAELAGMKQSQISSLEDVNRTSWTVRTLKKLAKALDLVLVVRFESYGKVLPDIEQFRRELLTRKSFKDDPVFSAATAAVALEESAAIAEQTDEGHCDDAGQPKHAVINAEFRFGTNGQERLRVA